jgi:hypothetical protein
MTFQADSRKVHQLITGLVHGEAAETWIKSVARRRNGRIDFRALTDHCGGAGNKSFRIKKAEVLRGTLTYKNERAVSFEKFIANVNLMFVAHAESEEVMSEDQKIRLLFEKITHPSLETVKSLPQVAENLDQTGAVNHEFIVNSISAEAANLSDFVPNRATLVALEPKELEGRLRMESLALTARCSRDSTRTSVPCRLTTSKPTSMRGSI